jgi:hypothetical protein
MVRSVATPPKTIAPMEPLPTGKASVHAKAGSVYPRQRSPVPAFVLIASNDKQNTAIHVFLIDDILHVSIFTAFTPRPLSPAAARHFPPGNYSSKHFFFHSP